MHFLLPNFSLISSDYAQLCLTYADKFLKDAQAKCRKDAKTVSHVPRKLQKIQKTFNIPRKCITFPA